MQDVYASLESCEQAGGAYEEFPAMARLAGWLSIIVIEGLVYVPEGTVGQQRKLLDARACWTLGDTFTDWAGEPYFLPDPGPQAVF